jgi:hypothetical protein
VRAVIAINVLAGAPVIDFASCISRDTLACGLLYPNNFRAATRRIDPPHSLSKRAPALEPGTGRPGSKRVARLCRAGYPGAGRQCVAAPYDNDLLAMASAGCANNLITGDKRDLLLLKQYETTAIVTVSDFLSSLWHLHQFR